MTTDERDDEDSAFEAGFQASMTGTERPAEPSAPALEAATEEGKVGPATSPATEAAAAAPEKPVPVEDPFASLPGPVRELLARLPAIEAELERTKRVAGLVPALQSKIDRLVAASERAPQKLEKVEALRKDVPEIADALDEMLAATRPAPTPEPEAPAPDAAPDPHEAALNAVRPTWADEVGSSGFQLWLATQPDRAEIMGTGDAGVLLGALTRWDQYRSALGNRSAPQPARQARMAAAVTPQGDGRRTRQPSAEDEEEAAMQAAFQNVRGVRNVQPLR